MTAPHRVIIWPKIQSILAVHSGDSVTLFQEIQHQGTTWFLRQAMAHKLQLPAESDLARQSHYIDYSLTESVFPGLSRQDAVAYAEAFFDCYHPFCPILDEERLMETMLPNTLRGDLGDRETELVLTLFVLALGKMAYHGGGGEFPNLMTSWLSIPAKIRSSDPQELRFSTKHGVGSEPSQLHAL